jgi:hypothetical protein
MRWDCVCACGTRRSVASVGLTTGGSKSCGCYSREVAKAAGDRTRTHGMTRTTTHTIWRGMIQRCHSETAKDFARYGGAGIQVCQRWRDSFADFLADMGERPAGRSLDRFPNRNGNYEPGNCRWATDSQQQRNKNNNHLLTHEGATLTMAEWSERLGINPITLHARIRRGWSDERALTTPVDMRYSRTARGA